jgi:hypothetical protein
MVATRICSGAGGRRCLVVALSLATLVPASAARAGTYTVTGCDATNRVDGWVATASPNYGTSYGAGCPGNPGAGGLVARNVGRADHSLAPYGSHGSWSFTAPQGTRVVGLSGDYYVASHGWPWLSGIRDPDSGYWLYCAAICPNDGLPWFSFSLGGLSLHAIALSVVCSSTSGCRRDGSYGAEAHLSRTTVTLADDWLPAVSITGGSLTTAGWHRGVQTLTYSAQDNTGIHQVQTLVDRQVVGIEQRGCDPRAVLPCPNGGGSMSLDTATTFRSDGKHTLGIQATDASGNAVKASRTVYVDNTAPGQPSALAVAGGGTWRSTNRFAATWMLPPADAGSPIAGIAYELCPSSGTSSCVDGTRNGGRMTAVGDLAVPRDGSWMLQLWLRDQAGNEDRNRSVVAGPLRLDTTPPSVQMLPSDPSHPAQVNVQATDAVSGVADVAIELHRHGTSEWRALATSRAGARFTGTIDDEALPAGTYDVRVRATDAAGNERSTTVNVQGRVATVRLPARIRSSLNVGQPVGHGRRRHLDSHITLPFGKSIVLVGRLTGPGGNPVQSSTVEVFAREALSGTSFARFGSIRTSSAGRFRFRVPAGASRIMRFRYPGTDLQRGFTRDVRIGVRASTTMTASPRTVVNGDYVTFRGRLRGRPLPIDGKLVELQVFTRRRWRTFAVPKASARTGRWSFMYRFEAVTGHVTFRFRAEIRHEASYPFETGRSRQVRVNVQGL